MRCEFQEVGSKGRNPKNIPTSRTSPIIGLIVLIFLVAVGLAYVGSATGKGSQYQTAAVQAQYLARQGIQERGLAYLRSLTQDELPTSQINLPSGEIAGVGSYRDVSVVPIAKKDSDVSYQISATGVVRIQNETGESVEVIDSENEEFRPVSFARFQHMTNYEESIFSELFKFWDADTLYGRVHSNDQIAIMGHPVFYGLVTTCAPDFWRGPGYNPYFAIPPQFNVPPVEFPDSVAMLRRCAAAQGRMFDGGGVYQFRLIFDPDGDWGVYRWHIGAPSFPPDTMVAQGFELWEANFFFFAPLELKGHMRGTVTVGSSEDIRLIDDIWYVDSRPGTGEVDTNSTNVLGIIAEGNIIVANTPENGRDNRTMGGQDIIINAAMIALNESFTFEDQNDQWNLYQGPYPDERGTIHFWGSMAQFRRGYAHRSNHGGSGYDKDYHYDTRFSEISPPCWPIVNNPEHQCLFDIVPPGEK
jgi:hypothetical protein